jgi:signal peptidase II
MVNCVILALLFLVDVFTKDIAFRTLAFGQNIALAPMISLCLAKNYGLGFGLGQNWTQLILIANLIILLIFSYVFYKNKENNKFIWILVLAGGFGNCFDRYFLGFVRDFILISWGTWSWPIFNIADIYISIAFILLIGTNKSHATQKNI